MNSALTSTRGRAVGLAGLAIVTVVGVLAFTVGPLAHGSGSTPAPTASTAALASPSATASPTPTETPEPTPTATPAPPPLPGMLAGIGDSYMKAYDPSALMAGYKDHPQYSFVFGTAKDDGVFSLRERFEALGAKPVMVDASKTGKKMSDAVRQANIVVAAAKKLPAGATVYVVFELGTNDLCGQPETPMTKPATFDAQARAAIKVLTDGLPADSRILMLSVPDFVHFRNITQADPTARAHFKEANNINRCPPFLGSNSTISLAAATRILSQYNDSLMAACADTEAGGKTHCASDREGLAEANFKIADLSKADYFHPSFTGQAKMAEAAWIHGYWNGMTLPTGFKY